VTVRARNEELTAKAASELAQLIRETSGEIKVGGPSPAPITRMRGYFRYNILLKAKDRLEMCALMKKVLAAYRKPHGVLIAVDVDPMSM
jgi:primosomal protein N' (replication factor Y)